MIYKSAVLFLLTTMFAFNSDAATPTIRCDHCFTAQDFVTQARSGGILGELYVYSLVSGVVHKYMVSTDQISGGGELPAGQDHQINYSSTGLPNATPMPVETGVVEFFEELSDIYLALGGSLHYSGVLNISTTTLAYGYPSRLEGLTGDEIQSMYSQPLAYLYLNDGIFFNAVWKNIRAAHNDNSWGSLLARLLGGNVTVRGITLGLNLSSQTSVEYTVELGDGSEFRVLVDKQSNQIEYVPGSLLDPAGNTVPDESHKYPGGNWQALDKNWYPSDVEAWLSEAERQGIPINNTGGSGTRCGRVNGGPPECWTFFN